MRAATATVVRFLRSHSRRARLYARHTSGRDARLGRLLVCRVTNETFQQNVVYKDQNPAGEPGGLPAKAAGEDTGATEAILVAAKPRLFHCIAGGGTIRQQLSAPGNLMSAGVVACG